MHTADDSIDANALVTPGFYQATSFINTPVAVGILIMPYYANGWWRFQVFVDRSERHMWFRCGTSSSYDSTWKQIV